MNLFPLIRPVLMRMEPEAAHRLTLLGLKAGLGPRYEGQHPSLKTTLWGKTFENPLGIAAGFDKDAEVTGALFDMGFGFVETGTVTPLPQPGNPRPRIFRDVNSSSVINRMGFPGRGFENFERNLKGRARQGVLGINIGINKDTPSPANDYRLGIEKFAPLADYITVNISSPNTAGLRDLQMKDHLEALLAGLPRPPVPLLVKVSPDLTEKEAGDIAGLALKYKIDGLIVSNTTLSRPAALAESLKGEKGGLSGRLLFDLSTKMIADFYRLTEGRVPIVGVGGIASAEDAYAKIRAGALLLQLYTALVFEGPGLIPRILQGLEALLQKNGFTCLAEAVGTGKTPLKAVV